MTTKLEDLNSRITNNSPQNEIYKYNNLVQEYNSLAKIVEEKINAFNLMVQKHNAKRIETHSIVSIGGGINLRPKDFKRTIRKAQTEKIREIKNVKENLLKAKQGTKRSQWICNNLASGKRVLRAAFSFS